MKKSRNTGSVKSSMDKKFIGKNSTGPNGPPSSPRSVSGQDHLSQSQIKRTVGYSNAK